MKDLINTLTNQMATERMVREYYSNFFSTFNSRQLFEIYDVATDRFVKFPGKEGSSIVNRDTLVRNLAEMEANHARVDNLLVIQYDDDDVYFNNPVFIG